MIRKHLIAITTVLAVTSVAASAVSATTYPNEDPSERHRAHVHASSVQGTPAWYATLRTPNGRYWDRVAWCETHRNWRDKGQWSGGLGIYTLTWRWFGGYQFAHRPWKASRNEQIVVANRIALHGFQPRNAPFRTPVGFNGWGCIKHNETLKPPVPGPFRIK